ncbi:hypothetical protein GOV09_06310 [Candidatus Woesearchaeota archaeon]|nr:hypothetical protein [Candidatus Woesearchaeota archaeon]
MDIPGQNELQKDISKMNPDNNARSRIIITSLIVFVVVLFSSVLLFQEGVERSFILGTCSVSGVTGCHIVMTGNEAVIELESEEYFIKELKAEGCTTELIEGKKATLRNCSISSVYNKLDISAELEHPVSTLVHKEEGNIFAFYETTKVKEFFKPLLG